MITKWTKIGQQHLNKISFIINFSLAGSQSRYTKLGILLAYGDRPHLSLNGKQIDQRKCVCVTEKKKSPRPIDDQTLELLLQRNSKHYLVVYKLIILSNLDLPAPKKIFSKFDFERDLFEEKSFALFNS